MAWPRRCWCQAPDVSIYAQIGNVGQGGLFLRTTSPLREGTRVTLRLALGHAGDEKAVDALVVWCDDARGMGLRFEALPQGLVEELRELLRALQSQ